MKNMKKATLLKAVVLLLICGLFMTPLSVSAAKVKKMEIKCKGKKTVKLGYDTNLIDIFEKKWGKPEKTVKGENGSIDVWYKGLHIQEVGIFVKMEVTKNNISVNGVKVGMKRAKAMKILEKRYGKKNVVCEYDEPNVSLMVRKKNSVCGAYDIRKGKVKKYHYSICR